MVESTWKVELLTSACALKVSAAAQVGCVHGRPIVLALALFEMILRMSIYTACHQVHACVLRLRY